MLVERLCLLVVSLGSRRERHRAPQRAAHGTTAQVPHRERRPRWEKSAHQRVKLPLLFDCPHRVRDLTIRRGAPR